MKKTTTTKWKKHYFECKCDSEEHRLVFIVDTYEPQNPEIYVSCYLGNYRNFFQRCWMAIKYIFRKTDNEGAFDCFLLRPEDYQRFVDMFKGVIEERNKNK